jgi:hypothetical protein
MKSIKLEFAEHIEFQNEFGVLHRENAPAREYFAGKNKGNWEWWYDGSPHREGGAACWDSIRKDYIWYVNGYVHNQNGPAHHADHNFNVWYNQGSRHRIGGPAWYSDKSKHLFWWKNGLRHRLNAPACMFKDNEENDYYYFEFGNLVKPGKPEKLIERISELKEAQGTMPQIKTPHKEIKK